MKTLIKTDRNGTKYYEEKCSCVKCNGTGIYTWYGYHYNGTTSTYSGICYDCNGTGKVTVTTKEYTEEHKAKLEAQREARIAKKEAEKQAEIEKAQAEEEARQKRIAEEKAKSEYIGQVGDKIDMVVTVAFKTSYEFPSFRGYGTTEMMVYGLKDENGNLLVWKTTSGYLAIEKERWNTDHTKSIIESIHAQKGDKIRIKATIKDHAEYKDQKQTIVTRVKTIEIIEQAEA